MIWIRLPETIPVLAVVVALGLAAGPASAEYHSENWDDPAARENDWDYYDRDVSTGSTDHQRAPMKWEPSGGLGGSGYVWTPLIDLDAAHNNAAFYPAYMTEVLDPAKTIDLTGPGQSIRVYLNDTTPAGHLNLRGGSVRFFIGEWDSGALPGPEDDRWAFFCTNASFFVNDHGWTTRAVVPVGTDADWTLLAASPAPLYTHASDLFVHPQQWGFVIFPASSVPSGTLAFDSFRIVPEPVTLALLGLGGLAVLRRRRP